MLVRIHGGSKWINLNNIQWLAVRRADDYSRDATPKERLLLITMVGQDVTTAMHLLYESIDDVNREIERLTKLSYLLHYGKGNPEMMKEFTKLEAEF